MEKIAVVTGGSQGIGHEIVNTFVQNGYFVIFTYYKHKEQAEKLESQYKNQTKCFYLDVKDVVMCQIFIDTVLVQYKRIDCLVNNAGVSLFKLALDCDKNDFDFVMNTNFGGVFNMTKCVLPSMCNQNFGRIINISSIWGQVGASFESLYSASKGAIDSFTKSIAKEMANKNITCNAVSPGIIETKMNQHLTSEEITNFVKDIPAERQGTTKEVANLCLFLANDSGYINGQIIGINGGLN